MNLLIMVLKIMAILLMETVIIKNVMHMFQQNRYDYKRYTAWLFKNLFNQLSFKLFLINFILGFALTFFDKQPQAIGFIILILFNSLILFENEGKKEYIKPLVFTSRVKRIISVLLIINIIIFGLIIYYINFPYVIGLIPFSLIVNWFLVYIADIILIPVELSIQKHYLNDAKRILNDHTDLIKIGITGSFGKTSSKNIIQSIISEEYRSLMTPASFNTPMGITKCIRELLKPVHQVFVCEMGADHVNDIKVLSEFVRPQFGIVTSIGPQHLETFGSLANIINEKMRLVELLDNKGCGILNYDNEHIRNYPLKNNCKIITYGIDCRKVDYRAFGIEYSIKGSKFKVKHKKETYEFETKLLGKHNISNILAGIALSRELHVEWKDIVRAVKQISYVEHRLEVKNINGYKFIDNAFNSNPTGAKMSLEVLKMMPNKRFIITPGMIDLGKIQDEVNFEFGKQMKDKADVVILVGEKQTESIKRGLLANKFAKKDIYICKTVKEAFGLVYTLASKEDTILLENDLPDAFNN